MITYQTYLNSGDAVVKADVERNWARSELLLNWSSDEKRKELTKKYEASRANYIRLSEQLCKEREEYLT